MLNNDSLYVCMDYQNPPFEYLNTLTLLAIGAPLSKRISAMSRKPTYRILRSMLIYATLETKPVYGNNTYLSTL
jgi:hypothetical protein